MENQPIGDVMGTAMDKIRSMVDSNMVVGQPIVTPDGVTLIPVSKVSFGFASGGKDKSASGTKPGVWAGSGASIKVEPVGFHIVREGTARMVSVQPPALTTADRVLDMVPELVEKLENYLDKHAKPASG